MEGPVTPAAEGDPSTAGKTLLEARSLSVWFPVRRRRLREREWIRAVDDVKLSVKQGETLAIVGESGCGKTTLGRALVMLQRPTAGEVFFDGRNLTPLRGRALRAARKRLQMIFQDPYSSLDPRQRVQDIVGEPLLIQNVDGEQRRQRVTELLNLVGLGAEAGTGLPREFSGGQRQRIGIARALAAHPSLIICDEPLSALDVSIQAQIVTLLLKLQRQLSLTYLFISHDMAVVRQVASRVAVMYLGSIVELAETGDLFRAPRHPYTVALLVAVPTLAKRGAPEPGGVLLTGDPPSPVHVPSGCRFHTRCWLRERLGNPERCALEAPALDQASDHSAACHFAALTVEHSAELLAGHTGAVATPGKAG
jgi:peptide/nickel transport system ATP-binding protein